MLILHPTEVPGLILILNMIPLQFKTLFNCLSLLSGQAFPSINSMRRQQKAESMDSLHKAEMEAEN